MICSEIILKDIHDHGLRTPGYVKPPKIIYSL
jgi:hypothetical protein